MIKLIQQLNDSETGIWSLLDVSYVPMRVNVIHTVYDIEIVVFTGSPDEVKAFVEGVIYTLFYSEIL